MLVNKQLLNNSKRTTMGIMIHYVLNIGMCYITFLVGVKGNQNKGQAAPWCPKHIESVLHFEV